jgi:Ca-activated chloride channel homolog
MLGRIIGELDVFRRRWTTLSTPREARGMRMSRHRRQASRWIPVALVAAALVIATTVTLVLRGSGDESTRSVEPTAQCPASLRIVAASSFAPVLTELAPTLESGDDCVHLEVNVADGRAAPQRVADLQADVWIPDDAAWAGAAGSLALAEAPQGGSGTVLATSPIYMVTDEATAGRLQSAGGSWLGLAKLATSDSGVKLAVRDPAGSGDGLVGVGDVGEAVWLDQGMDASAYALATAHPRTRTVTDGQAMPAASGEVGLVAEYALARPHGEGGGAAPAGSRILAGSDHTAILRYTWLPTAAAVEDPIMTGLIARVLSALTDTDADDAIAKAGLRRPGGPPPPSEIKGLPELKAPPFDVLIPHKLDHVFATWYPADRRSDILVVVDVSGSMGAPAPGSKQPLINLVRSGVLELGKVLPNDSKLALWEFGSDLAPPRDYRTLMPRGTLNDAQRNRLTRAAHALDARNTGTGLYDTLLAAYKSAQAGYRDGIPDHVVLFTDGKNEDDPGSITATELSAKLSAAANPKRPVHVTVISFGPKSNAEAVAKALEPVGGYVDPLTAADEVGAAFIHSAAGGVHH